MQPIKYFHHWLNEHANSEHFLFSFQDLRALQPNLTYAAFKALLSRAVDAGYLTRVCRGLYVVKKAIPPTGLLLFHAVAILRANKFNYISLETVLSEAGIISQIPMNWITAMSSGRNNIISCGEFGTIEFIHTHRKPTDVMDQLTYDHRYGLWRASIPLALKDMKITHRNLDLIDWDIANEFI
jgi:hypothetical protein